MNTKTQKLIFKTLNNADKMQWPQIAFFRNEENKEVKLNAKNLLHLIDIFEAQIKKGNYFYRFGNTINREQYPQADLLECALRMWCFDCKKTFLINGNFTSKVFCEHCTGDNIDHDTLYNYSKQNKA